ncbi:hypothetical protein EUTSA_v10011044mg [Eutrema salsugineum]|uniref:F-box domain-containing protein n=1 Tax=Eutrema salsugineum TaxID=72664 RepID=V4NHE1_EUTSA|nr:F-box protein DOR [Eutrema salsugineum]ESQ45591.1 hypothetical protein EUTSA_v10011044mg [Eutrema salsugineum]
MSGVGRSIPRDLVIEILSRLPVKSIARFRCVSKRWASTLYHPDFTDLFLKKSLARPRLFFVVKLRGKFVFFSTPLPLNPDQNSSSPLVADLHMSFSTEDSYSGVTPPVCGWLCSKVKNPVMCNPSTGQFITLPKVTLTGTVHTYLGYDPINKLFKVLCVSEDGCRVLTFGNGDMSWRMIDCPIPHSPLRNEICINGVLYYAAASTVEGMPPYLIVCFDVRFENFTFLVVNIKIWNSNLINCNGKLGAVLPDSFFCFTRRSTSLQLWVLEDVENQKWSKHSHVFPPLWRDIVGELNIVGMTGTGEFVFAPNAQLNPYIFFYNVVRNTVRRVRVQIQLGALASKYGKIYTFVDHVQDVKLMEAPRSS